jgi:excisionase family DNA binding protein
MNTPALMRLDSPGEIEQARASSRTLSKYADAERVRLTLQASNGSTDELILPGAVLQVLLDALAQMAQGNAVSLLPVHQELSTQDAANLLNVSRPFLVGLLEQGQMPFRKVGTHRRVLLSDVLAYRERIDHEREQALDELAAIAQQDDMGY